MTTDRATAAPTAAATSQPQPARRTIWVLAGLAAAIAAVALVGWIFDVPQLTRLSPHLASMKFNTALCVCLLAASWMTAQSRIVVALASIPGLIGVMTLVEYAVHHSLGIDQLIVSDPHSVANVAGRMAVASAASIVVLATCRILIATDRPRWVPVGSGAVIVVAGVGCLGYLYGVRSLYRIGPVSTLSIQTAAALLLLALATWLATPGLATWILHGSDAGAVMMRRLMPVALGALPVIGWAVLLGVHAHRYDAQFAMALCVTASAVLLTAVAVRAARRLADVDRRRTAALFDLTALNETLEDRVRARTARLQVERSRVAVLEDRERIAADLHDHVIQRLFGLGLQLAAAAGRGPRVDHTPMLRDAIDDIDAAIQELRVTIFSLKQMTASPDPFARLRACVDESTRVLGFEPTFAADGDPAYLPDPILGTVEGVLREALSNVARHAAATAAGVDLRIDEAWVTLTVRDDGVGFDPAAVRHASGTTNILRRAEQLGGSATWTRGDPHGTTLTWRVRSGADPPE